MSIYQHFRVEEREFIDQVLEWKEFVESSYSARLTDFLDPREQQIVATIVGKQGEVKVDFFGGTDGCERKRALLYPDYLIPNEEDFHIQLMEIDYPRKFITIEHRQVLGSLMSLGLKRGKYGDILIGDGRVQFFVAEEISDYIKLELTQIGRAHITLNEQPLSNSLVISEQWENLTTTVSSLRLDVMLSAIYNISRQKSQMYIKQGVVKVNWTIIENPAFECGIGDVLSVRGFGRSRVVSIEGKTKKEKWRIIVGKQR